MGNSSTKQKAAANIRGQGPAGRESAPAEATEARTPAKQESSRTKIKEIYGPRAKTEDYYGTCAVDHRLGTNTEGILFFEGALLSLLTHNLEYSLVVDSFMSVSQQDTALSSYRVTIDAIDNQGNVLLHWIYFGDEPEDSLPYKVDIVGQTARQTIQDSSIHTPRGSYIMNTLPKFGHAGWIGGLGRGCEYWHPDFTYPFLLAHSSEGEFMVYLLLEKYTVQIMLALGPERLGDIVDVQTFVADLESFVGHTEKLSALMIDPAWRALLCQRYPNIMMDEDSVTRGLGTITRDDEMKLYSLYAKQSAGHLDFYRLNRAMLDSKGPYLEALLREILHREVFGALLEQLFDVLAYMPTTFMPSGNAGVDRTRNVKRVLSVCDSKTLARWLTSRLGTEEQPRAKEDVQNPAYNIRLALGNVSAKLVSLVADIVGELTIDVPFTREALKWAVLDIGKNKKIRFGPRSLYTLKRAYTERDSPPPARGGKGPSSTVEFGVFVDWLVFYGDESCVSPAAPTGLYEAMMQRPPL